MKKNIFFLLGLTYFFLPQTNAQVYINEWMSSNSSVILRDVMGSELLKSTLNGRSTLDLSDFSRGVYFVSIENEAGEIVGGGKLVLVGE